MSGGYFNYDQYKIGYISDQIEDIVDKYTEDGLNQYGDRCRVIYTEEEIEKFKEACYTLEKAQIYAQRIDWLLSGDDGTDSFFRRLELELKELEEKYEQKRSKT